MAKRRTSGIQRRERASAEALGRRLDAPRAGSGLPDWRLLLIGGVVVVGVLILALVVLFGSGPNPNAGTQCPDDGTSHTDTGTSCRTAPGPCGASGNPYSSLPATSGPHWGTPANWAVYSTP